MKLSKEQVLELKPIAEAFKQEWDKEENKLCDSYSEETRNFLKGYYARAEEVEKTELGSQLSEYLKDASHKPSDFFKNTIAQFPGWIAKPHLEAFFACVDQVRDWQISDSMFRRSMRSSRYGHYLVKIMGIVRSFHKMSIFDTDIVSVYRLNVRPGLYEYMLLHSDSYSVTLDAEWIAAELDLGNAQLEDLLAEILTENANNNMVSWSLIRGIVMSHCARLHELLGKLLLAARLQEGLRQAICESMDCGTVEAFVTLLKVIEDNNLLRYSSVKRAAATWTGLIIEEEKDFDRISQKELTLIRTYIEDENAVKEGLQSEDSMKLYLALWSIGFRDVVDVRRQLMELVTYGSIHQMKVACVYLNMIEDNNYDHQLAKILVLAHPDNLALMAGAISHFMKGCWNVMSSCIYGEQGFWRRNNDEKPIKRAYMDVSRYFESKEECETYYNLLYGMLEQIPKKCLEFPSYVFSWNQAALTTNELLIRLAYLASALKDEEKITQIAAKLERYDVGNYGSRSLLIAVLLAEPVTPEQKRLLVGEVADKEESSRKQAMKLVEPLTLEKEHYEQLEAMLRYKREDIRANVLKLLYPMKEEWLLETIERLLKDKKEENRTAGLDLILQLKKDEKRQSTYIKACDFIDMMPAVTGKEEILIQEIKRKEENGEKAEQGYGLFDVNADYIPILNEEYILQCQEVFASWFPDSKLMKDSLAKHKKKDSLCQKNASLGKEKERLEKLSELIDENKNLEYENHVGNTVLLGENGYFGRYNEENFPAKELWDDFYAKEIGTIAELWRMKIRFLASSEKTLFRQECSGFIEELYGKDFSEAVTVSYSAQMWEILGYLEKKHKDEKMIYACAVAIAKVLLEQEGDLYREDEILGFRGNVIGKQKRNLAAHRQIACLIKQLDDMADLDEIPDSFPLYYALSKKVEFSYTKEINKEDERVIYNYDSFAGERLQFPAEVDYMIAYSEKIISKDFLYKAIFTLLNTAESIYVFSNIFIYIRERDRELTKRSSNYIWEDRQRKEKVEKLLGHPLGQEITEKDQKRLEAAEEFYTELSVKILETELKRGDTETIYSKWIYSIRRVYGVDYFVRILAALGRQTLERSTWFDAGYHASRENQVNKKQSLCHLLQVCMPDVKDDAKALKKRLKGTDITEQRLVEAALYAPEWIPMVGEYLGWQGFTSGCYYFMAHMKEAFDDKRKAMIARYTPLTIEELNDGAFDVGWFEEIYKQLGKEHFDSIYDAAKYISDGAKHTRARKYADAVLGKYKEKHTEHEITEKRNKDLVMAYSLLPIKKENQVEKRYLFLQKFLKESKQYGAQRRASEKLAVQNSMINLANNAGYSDVTRLTLKMESRIADQIAPLFQPKEIGDGKVWLEVDLSGSCNIICEKGDKRLKSIPAKWKKDDYIKQLTESRKQLKEQRIRTRQMLEEAMEHETEFTFSECTSLLNNPVMAALISTLVVKADGQYGFVTKDGLQTIDSKTGKEEEIVAVDDESTVIIAHPYHLYAAGCWHAFQQYLFDQQIKQPFKQVFRELYVKTEEELHMHHSLRYAGNQIQPAKTIGCLKGRHWVADAEAGLQKVYYKENIVAQIYALADWFSPADIESPTLEWVVFTDRKTYKEIPIGEIPDLIFSEVMRDVDMAVSVAHAGGVDPETSHSTVEMRRAIAEFTLPLFKLDNVTFTGNHALITGSRADYSVHLGSGVVHQQGGTMIQVLPVHSQHRGKLFLPFVDEDPKTAEVISKILLFAEDDKIKDPFILEQIHKG